MAYDFDTDIINFTRYDDVDAPILAWAIRLAKTIYICGNPADYDEDESDVDNILVAMLASGFITMYANGVSVAVDFSLDELSVKEDAGVSPEGKFFDMFYHWLNMYKRRGCALQYADATSLLAVTAFVPVDFVNDIIAVPVNGDQ